MLFGYLELIFSGYHTRTREVAKSLKIGISGLEIEVKEENCTVRYRM